MGLRFIRCEDGSYVHVRNVTRLSVEVTYDDKATIKAHHNGPSMPFTVAEFGTSRDASSWLMDLIDRIECAAPAVRPRAVRALKDKEEG